MPILDFTEIPPAKATKFSSGSQDTFELFARDVLELVGFQIISAPGRGADGGKDIIVKEIRKGVGGQTSIYWLVSCKHYAHGGASVTPDDELNIIERVQHHQCNGFFGFYSTIPSAGLQTRLDNLSAIETLIYDRETIERRLIESDEGRCIARRYCPKSMRHVDNPITLADKFIARACLSSKGAIEKVHQLVNLLNEKNEAKESNQSVRDGDTSLIAAFPFTACLNAGTGSCVYDLSRTQHDGTLIGGGMWCEEGIRFSSIPGFIDLGQRLPLTRFSMILLFIPQHRKDGAMQSLIDSAPDERAFGVFWSLGKLIVASHFGQRMISETEVPWKPDQVQILLIRCDGFRRLWFSTPSKWTLLTHRLESPYYRVLGQRECMIPYRLAGPGLMSYNNQRIECWNGVVCGAFIWNRMFNPRTGFKLMNKLISFWRDTSSAISESAPRD